MWAGTVVAPPGETSAAVVSITSRSRSVAVRLRLPLSAVIRTLARIGIVFRRSTTRYTWPSDFSNSARSTVTFMEDPLRREKSREPGVAVPGLARNAGPWAKGDKPGRISQVRDFAPRSYPRGVHWVIRGPDAPEVRGGAAQIRGLPDLRCPGSAARHSMTLCARNTT